MAHITYKSQLDKLNVKPENIDLNSTEIQIQERLEDQVFGGKCPTGSPYSHGYRCITYFLFFCHFEDGTWNPGIYFTTTFSLFKMFNREKMLYHPLMSKYTMRHLATGQLPRVLPHDIVISW